MSDNPIGIFDSGIGGLTVVKELIKILPDENIVYFGDTGRVPYGTRSNQTILQYSKQDIDFLLSKNVKMIIAACGTVSAVLPQDFVESKKILYSGVVLPAARSACLKSVSGRIGVIGTTAAIKSGAYKDAIEKIRSDSVFIGNACPLLVSLVENGCVQRNNQITKLVAQNYLKPFIENKVDTLILGCTHFPIIKDIIADIMGDGVVLIDPGKETAHFAAELLSQNNLLNTNKKANHKFYVSDDLQNFTKNAGLFLGCDIDQKIDMSLVSLGDSKTSIT